MKKLLCGVLSTAMLLCGAAVVNADVSFSDLDTAKWAESYILEMAEMGFVTGYNDGTFKPNKEVTHLEGLVLFSRAMGSNSEAMEKVLEYAVDEYGSTVDKYNLSFGKQEVCFMLYRGALTVDELDSYIGKSVANTPMKRYEAAMIITKAMSGEKKAQSELLLDLTYDDAKEIPAKATKYVYYVTENGIMNGVSGNAFAPNSSVTRGQIAVMLSRAVDAMGISFIDTTLEKVITANASVVTSDGTFTYTANTVMCAEGKKTDASSMPKNADATLVVVNDELVFVDTYSSTSVESINAVFYDYYTSNGIITLRVKADGESGSRYYECVEGVKVLRDGDVSSIGKFNMGERVSLTVENDIVTVISSNSATTKITDAEIEDISIDDDLIITISHEDPEYDGAELYVASDVTVVKNGSKDDISNIFRGDKVTLTLEYGQVTKISATSKKTTVEGTIREIHISSSPYMVISVNGNETKYDVPSKVSIKVDGEEGTIYDFRLSDTVKITIESQAITSITAVSSPSSAQSITAGTVTAVNLSYPFIKVSYDDNGVTREETIMCKNSAATTVIGADGKSASLKNIKVGNVVTVRGKIDNGAFIASLIIIEAE